MLKPPGLWHCCYGIASPLPWHVATTEGRRCLCRPGPGEARGPGLLWEPVVTPLGAFQHICPNRHELRAPCPEGDQGAWERWPARPGCTRAEAESLLLTACREVVAKSCSLAPQPGKDNEEETPPKPPLRCIRIALPLFFFPGGWLRKHTR